MTVLGVVGYLNAIPLVAALPPAYRTRAGDPSDLSRWLAGGEVDAALLPVAEALRGVGDGALGAHGIACDGPVDSVLAFLPAAFSLDPARDRSPSVVLDPASRTSVALLRVLLEARHGLAPRYRVAASPGPDPAADASAITLVIGDRAFVRRRAWSGTVLDLGAAWTAWTGLPFVFARWTARRGLAAPERGALATQLDAAATAGIARIEELATVHGPTHGLSAADAIRYLRVSVRHRIDARAEAGFHRFAEEVARLRPLEGAVDGGS